MKVIPKLSLLCLLVLFGGTAAAQTPDGEPPSAEDVCAGLSGDAYGICNAYCEAMDCDSPERKASERACEQKYQKFRELTDEDPPCGVACPCIGRDFPVFTSFADGTREITACTLEVMDPETTLMTIDSSAAGADVFIVGENATCEASDPVPVPALSEEDFITPAQASACIALLVAAAEDDLFAGVCSM